jgi:hypothetical protein
VKKKKIKPHDNNAHSAIRGVLGMQNIIDHYQWIGLHWLNKKYSKILVGVDSSKESMDAITRQ